MNRAKPSLTRTFSLLRTGFVLAALIVATLLLLSCGAGGGAPAEVQAPATEVAAGEGQAAPTEPPPTAAPTESAPTETPDAVATEVEIARAAAATLTAEAPTATVAPTQTTAPDTPTPEPQPTNTTAPDTPTSPPPTDTPTSPPPTDTPVPPTPTPKPTKRPTNTPEVAFPPVTLIAPLEKDAGSLRGPVTFQWSYPRPLNSDEAFQVLIWGEGQPHWGAAELWTETEQTIDLDVVLAQRGGPGQYFWTVVVRRKGTEELLSPEGSPWRLTWAGDPCAFCNCRLDCRSGFCEPCCARCCDGCK